MRRAAGWVAGLCLLAVAGFFYDQLRPSEAFSHVQDFGTDTNGFLDVKVGEPVWAAWDAPNLEPNRPVVVEKLEFIGKSPHIEVLGKYVMDRTYPGNWGGTMTGKESHVWGPDSGWKREALAPAIGATLPVPSISVPELYFVVRMKPTAPGNHVIEGWRMTYRDPSGRVGVEEYRGKLVIETSA